MNQEPRERIKEELKLFIAVTYRYVSLLLRA